MRFFIPPHFTGKEAVDIYNSVVKHLSDFGIKVCNTKKIYSLSFWYENDFFTEMIGGKCFTNNEPISIILETEDDYCICTPNNGVVRNLPISLSKTEIILETVEYFNNAVEFYKYGDWTYKLDEDNNHKVEHLLEQPKALYKYYSNTEWNRNAVVNTYLFCSHPYHLNDPMDFSYLLWDLSNMTEGRYVAFFELYNLPINVSYLIDESPLISAIFHKLEKWIFL